MKVAIQQPYFYPYLGYYKLISSVDLFVLLNDVQYIRRGWVNRNRIEDNTYITVPVKKCPRSSLINEIKIDYGSNWHYRHCRYIETKYGKGCIEHPVFKFYKNIKNYNFLACLLKDSIQNVCDFLEIKTKIVDSEQFEIKNKKGEDRILEICKKLNAKEYFNLPGGRSLYEKDTFLKKGIDLKFVGDIENKLSIIDFIFSNKDFKND